MGPMGIRVPENTKRKSGSMLREIEEIEDAQAALRDSIEATKELAEKAETLLQKHKARIEHQQS